MLCGIHPMKHLLFDSPSRILRFCDRWIYRKIKQTPQFSQELANFPQILGLDTSRDVIEARIQSKKVVSQFEKWNEQPCVLIMADLQELHWTNVNV